jgi:hypothetical protein
MVIIQGISMNYLGTYINLIRKAEKRDSVETYSEKHHVFPVSIYGKNDRIVILTGREHFIAHWLLYKMCLKRYGNDHPNTIKMSRAWWNMSLNHNNKRYNSRSFEYARKAMAESFKGEKNPSKKPGVGAKISNAKRGIKRNDIVGKSFFGASPETVEKIKEKIRDKKIGKKVNYPKNRKSAPCSEEKAEKIRQTRLNAEKRFQDMTQKDFEEWISKQKLFCKDGKRKNSNVTRALIWRNIPLDIYYVSD